MADMQEGPDDWIAGSDGPDDWISPPAPETPSGAAAFVHGAVRGAAPAAGGWAGMAAGAKLGALIGSYVRPGIGTAVGGAAGAIGGAFGGAWLTAEGQEELLKVIPENVKELIGQTQTQREAEQLAHPYLSMAGELAPNLALVRPGAIAKAREGAGLLEKTLSHPVGARAVGAGFGGAQEAATELAVEGEIDPGKVAIAAGAGALMTRETGLGRKIRTGIEDHLPGPRVPVSAPEDSIAPILEADSVDDAIRAAELEVEADPDFGAIPDAGAAVPEVEALGAGAMEPPSSLTEMPQAEPVLAPGQPGADWEVLYDERGREIGWYNDKTQEMAFNEPEVPEGPKLEDLASFLARRGGIRNDEAHDLIKGRGLQQFVPGLGPLIRKDGMSIDYAGEALHEAGFFGPPESTPRPTENEVLQLLEKTARGIDRRPTKVYSQTDQAEFNQAADFKRASEDNDRALQDIYDQAKKDGEDLSEAEALDILEMMGARGIDPESAMAEHIERKVLRGLYSDHELTGDQIYAEAAPLERGEGESDFGLGEGFDGPAPVPGDPGGEGPAGAAAAQNSAEALPLAVERGAGGFDQTIIPGAEPSAIQLAEGLEVQGHGRATIDVPQQPANEGLFAQTRDGELPFQRREDAGPGAPGDWPRVTGTWTEAFDPQRESFGPVLRQRLDKLGLTDIALKLPDAINVTQGDQVSQVNGAYAQKIIAVAMDGPAPGETINHEAVHALRSLGLFTKSEWSILNNRAGRDWRARYDIDKRYGDLGEDKRNEEAIAEAFKNWVADRGTQKGTIASLFDKLRNALAAIRSVFRDAGFETAESIFHRIESGEVGARDRAAPADGEVLFERRGEDGQLMRAVYIKSTGAIEFRPAPQPKPAGAPREVRDKPLRPIEGTGDDRQRAINGEIYNVGEEAPQMKAAEDLVKSQPGIALAIAMRKRQAPAGVHPEFIYMALESQATREGNVELQRQLSNSKIAQEATTMGQRIAAWRNRAEIAPVDDMRRLQEARAKKLQERGIDAEKAVNTIVTQAQNEIRKAAKSTKRPTWNDFILGLVCPK